MVGILRDGGSRKHEVDRYIKEEEEQSAEAEPPYVRVTDACSEVKTHSTKTMQVSAGAMLLLSIRDVLSLTKLHRRERN